MNARVAIDIGGTFTDLVGLDSSGKVIYTKSLTTYDNLANGVLDCLRKASIGVDEIEYFIHGSTIAINTVIQKNGALTGLITSKGFRDVYEIGRSNRPDAYNLAYQRPVPLISREFRLEVTERLGSDGSVRQGLVEDEVRDAARALRRMGVQAVAVVFLHSYINPDHEVRAGEIIREEFPDAFVSLSHKILREFREYERTSTTVLNAYVAPVVSHYVGALEDALRREGFSGSFMIMQSNGGVMSAANAKELPVAMMESGPVAGVIGTGKLGAQIGIANLISFDMGGTTAKASLVIDGQSKVVTGYHIGGYESGYPMMLPVIDIVEVGTGGGSIAWLDAAGALKVGPLSAGSTPGPVCYNRGGDKPTVTDANLILGRLDEANFLGGEMRLDLEAAREAMRVRIADPLGMTIEQAALGIIRIADAKMSLAVREVSVAKGYDPRDFALTASGGAGPLHAVAVARELSIPKVIIPELPGTFSAYGMLYADVRHDYVRTNVQPQSAADPRSLTGLFLEMEREAGATLTEEGIGPSNSTAVRTIDLRYRGQEYTLNVAVPSTPLTDDALKALRSKFDELHYAQYQHSSSSQPVEIVNLRVSAVGLLAGAMPKKASGKPVASDAPRQNRKVYFEGGAAECQVLWRDNLRIGETIMGPAVIEELVSTTVLHPGDRATLHESGAIIVEIGKAS